MQPREPIAGTSEPWWCSCENESEINSLKLINYYSIIIYGWDFQAEDNIFWVCGPPVQWWKCACAKQILTFVSKFKGRATFKGKLKWPFLCDLVFHWQSTGGTGSGCGPSVWYNLGELCCGSFKVPLKTSQPQIPRFSFISFCPLRVRVICFPTLILKAHCPAVGNKSLTHGQLDV